MNAKGQPVGASARVLQDLDVSEDDFSYKLTLADDPHFWWRVEKSDAPDQIMITDFTPGAQDDAVMSSVLEFLLAERNHAPLTVIFHDLVPQEMDPGRHRIELTRVASAITRWSEAAAARLGHKVAEIDIGEHRGKARMFITYG